MFSHNHPYLFFTLALITTIATTIIFITWIIYLLVPKEKMNIIGNMGVIKIEGTIKQSDNIIHCLKNFSESKNIKAIIVRIDSPGGSVGPSQEIYNQIRKTSSKKPIITTMGSVAASGGYYVASASDYIIANPGTLTGSIGVIMSFVNIKQLIEKIGLHKSIIKSGNYKDIGSPLRNMTEDEHQILQTLSDDIHDQFISDIAISRNMDKSRIKSLADGQIFTGKRAIELGLIDALGNFDDAIEYAKKVGKIKSKVKLVYQKDKTKSLQNLLGIISDIVFDKIISFDISKRIA